MLSLYWVWKILILLIVLKECKSVNCPLKCRRCWWVRGVAPGRVGGCQRNSPRLPGRDTPSRRGRRAFAFRSLPSCASRWTSKILCLWKSKSCLENEEKKSKLLLKCIGERAGKIRTLFTLRLVKNLN